ncbi:phage tail protein [Paraherbaspirillum soli]|uniref:Phage tail protein n=1 Tax=Paraherbaspirillum soli TaxID=631222 RepID=A0ABW0MB17_9BURK
MEVFVGSIMTFGFDFAPLGWQTCSGQTLGIAQYSALFSLLGTHYGGDGVRVFQLPNLQGRLPISQGAGLGLTPRVIGEASGTEDVTLLVGNMPAHTHVATFTPSGGSAYNVSSNTAGNTIVPTATNNVLAGSPGGPSSAAIWATSTPAPSIPLGGVNGGGGGAVINGITGSSLPTAIMNPFLVLNFSIALVGVFPPRN